MLFAIAVRSRHQKLDEQRKNEGNGAEPGDHIMLSGKLIAFIHDDIAKKNRDGCDDR